VSQAKPDRPSHFVGGRPKPPAHLSAAAKVEFRRVSKILGQRQVETPGDFAAIALYATVYDRWIALKTEVAANYTILVTILDSHGEAHETTKVNPLLKELNATEGRLLALIRELGITPASREKVKPTVGGDQSENDAPQPGTVGWQLLHGGKE
jgi:P27 family predicted phage terminase small subunit